MHDGPRISRHAEADIHKHGRANDRARLNSSDESVPAGLLECSLFYGGAVRFLPDVRLSFVYLLVGGCCKPSAYRPLLVLLCSVQRVENLLCGMMAKGTSLFIARKTTNSNNAREAVISMEVVHAARALGTGPMWSMPPNRAKITS